MGEGEGGKEGGRTLGGATHVEEVAGIEAVPVQRHRPITHQQVDKLGDEFLRVLVGTVDIISARDDQWEVERARVGLGNKLGARLGRGVRIRGLCGQTNEIDRELIRTNADKRGHGGEKHV